jgi:hypothetical protein
MQKIHKVVFDLAKIFFHFQELRSPNKNVIQASMLSLAEEIPQDPQILFKKRNSALGEKFSNQL